MIKFQWSNCCTVLFPFSHEPSEHDAWAQMPRSGKRIRDSRFISQLGVGVTGWTWSSRQTECSQNKHCEVSRKNVLLFWLKDKKNWAGEGSFWCQASNELYSSCYHDSRVSLSWCHCSPRLCARTAGYVPRQTPSCPAFFLWTGPSDILVTERRIWLHTKGNVRAVLCLWKRY